MSDDLTTYNFSQRNGTQPIPNQLELEQVSEEFRRLIHYALDQEIDRVVLYGPMHEYFDGQWKRVAQDLHVRFFQKPISSFENDPNNLSNTLERFIFKSKYDELFNLIEFFTQHTGSSDELKKDLARAFIDARTAYRLKDNIVIAVGTKEQAEVLLRAIEETDTAEYIGARRHLIAAAQNLSNRDWVGSIRDSIHAVEAAAVRLAPGSTLGPALSTLEKQGNLNGSLKKAFAALYGFTSDNKTGIRHANVYGTDETVDETDALFMLGACASFVSYLISRNIKKS